MDADGDGEEGDGEDGDGEKSDGEEDAKSPGADPYEERLYVEREVEFELAEVE